MGINTNENVNLLVARAYRSRHLGGTLLPIVEQAEQKPENAREKVQSELSQALRGGRGCNGLPPTQILTLCLKSGCWEEGRCDQGPGQFQVYIAFGFFKKKIFFSGVTG